MSGATRRVLVLGGTAEARALAALLVEVPGTVVVSSLAGRVADPRLPVGEVRIGGFGGAAGLARWLSAQRIDAVVDATHPYAARMRVAAIEAARAAGVPHVRLERPGWTAQPGDRWYRVADVDAAVRALPTLGRRVLLTTGRQSLAAFLPLTGVRILARVVDAPVEPIPPHVRLLRSRGPYTVEGELELMRAHDIDVVVTKDSGGPLTEAKLVAARRLDLPVLMIDRPKPPVLPAVVHTADEAAGWLAGLPAAQPG
ncbi:cobalt-precorrin-6A reductase [Micromonospora peucetia]|uniref:Precorrin-6A/cobalt-precorrin-6A reductase n=1 Tax=Micromonospora peucetia TaxID=47871 RepID=A0A1C6VUP3_9ACTN|nr:cobalt-precorrin-6A reductase [Micromonospora peucetia]SCL70079.1 precorrin-6A/cobalt-precorrin-6A reductase [Micromonospora peucetia]